MSLYLGQVLRLEGRLQELEERLSAEETARTGAEEALQRMQAELEEQRTSSEQHLQVHAHSRPWASGSERWFAHAKERPFCHASC